MEGLFVEEPPGFLPARHECREVPEMTEQTEGAEATKQEMKDSIPETNWHESVKTHGNVYVYIYKYCLSTNQPSCVFFSDTKPLGVHIIKRTRWPASEGSLDVFWRNIRRPEFSGRGSSQQWMKPHTFSSTVSEKQRTRSSSFCLRPLGCNQHGWRVSKMIFLCCFCIVSF